MLIILGGLPGSGKTTIARELARTLRAVHLRIDTIAEAIWSYDNNREIGPLGYLVAYDLALDNLRLDLNVIADSVNGIEITRTAWREVARKAGKPFIEANVVCSDPLIHRNRLETRSVKQNVTWQEVLDRQYEPWQSVLTLDTSKLNVEDAVGELLAKLEI